MMADATVNAVTSSILVGRAVELETLRHLLNLAHDRHGQVVLLSGEAAIGKARPVAEVKANAAQMKFSALNRAMIAET
jgi:predicted ATPase